MAAVTDYIASVNASASQLSHVEPMTVPDVYALVTLMGLYLSDASGHQKAYKELLAYIDDGHALTLEKVQSMIIRFSNSHAPRAFALTHAGDSSVCNHRCPRCCASRDSREASPRPSRSTSPRSHTSSRAGTPRRTFSATAAPIHIDWRDHGLDQYYYTFAAILQNNHVSPHQVLLDADIDDFSHPEAGEILMRAASNTPNNPPLTTTMRDFFLLLYLLVGSVQDFSFRGLFIWRAVVSLLFFSAYVFGGLDQPLFATRWSCHLFEILIPF